VKTASSEQVNALTINRF